MQLFQNNRILECHQQHKESKGVVGIFGGEAKLHDLTVGEISHHVLEQLQSEYPMLSFRYRKSVEKKESKMIKSKISHFMKKWLFFWLKYI